MVITTQKHAKPVKKAAYSARIIIPVTYAKMDGKHQQYSPESLEL